MEAYLDLSDTELIEEVFRLLDEQEAEHDFAIGLALGVLSRRAFDREMEE